MNSRKDPDTAVKFLLWCIIRFDSYGTQSHVLKRKGPECVILKRQNFFEKPEFQRNSFTLLLHNTVPHVISFLTGRYELNKLTSLPMCGFITVAPLVEHPTGIAEVTGSNIVEVLMLSNYLNWKKYCDDHSSLSSTTVPQFIIMNYVVYTSDHFIPHRKEDMNSIN